MFRATTPLHKFVFDLDPELFKEILITYAQNGRIIVEKRKEDLSFEPADNDCYQASVKLTQAEANRFRAGEVNIQIRVLTLGGDALACEIKTIPVKDVLNDEVLK